MVEGTRGWVRVGATAVIVACAACNTQDAGGENATSSGSGMDDTAGTGTSGASSEGGTTSSTDAVDPGSSGASPEADASARASSEGSDDGREGSSGDVDTIAIPCGIYLAGADRPVDWVRGSLATLHWTEVEPAPGAYDFAMLQGQVGRAQPGHRFALRMTGREPSHIVEGAAQTWVWIDPNEAHDECPAPDGCERPVPWDEPSLDRFEAFVAALAAFSVTVDGVTAPLAAHPNLGSIMLTLPGWGRIREIGFEIEALPGYERDRLIAATTRALRIQAEAFPETPVITQFFEIDDGDEPPLWVDLRDAILADPTLDAVGFYQENLAHSRVDGVETFRPVPAAAEVLFTSQAQTFTALQALTSWADPGQQYTAQIENGSPIDAIRWAWETYGTRHFELYAQDVDAAIDGARPEWLPEFEALGRELCAP